MENPPSADHVRNRKPFVFHMYRYVYIYIYIWYVYIYFIYHTISIYHMVHIMFFPYLSILDCCRVSWISTNKLIALVGMISLKTRKHRATCNSFRHRGGKWCDEKRSASSLEAVVFSPMTTGGFSPSQWSCWTGWSAIFDHREHSTSHVWWRQVGVVIFRWYEPHVPYIKWTIEQ